MIVNYAFISWLQISLSLFPTKSYKLHFTAHSNFKFVTANYLQQWYISLCPTLPPSVTHFNGHYNAHWHINSPQYPILWTSARITSPLFAYCLTLWQDAIAMCTLLGRVKIDIQAMNFLSLRNSDTNREQLEDWLRTPLFECVKMYKTQHIFDIPFGSAYVWQCPKKFLYQESETSI